MRERPLRSRGPKPKIEEDAGARERTKTTLPIPDGSPEFKDGYREGVEMFSLHRPNKRGVTRILEEHAITLEEACMRSMTREHVARYEGYRACLKALRSARLLK